MSKNKYPNQLQADYESGLYTNAYLEEKYHYSKGYVSTLAKKHGWVKAKPQAVNKNVYDTEEDLKQSPSRIKTLVNKGESLSKIGKKVGLPYDEVKTRAMPSLSLRDIINIIDTQISNNDEQIHQLTNANEQLNIIRKFAIDHLSEERF